MFTIHTSLMEEKETLVVGLFHNDTPSENYKKLNERLDGALDHYIENGDLTGEYKRVEKVLPPKDSGVKRIYFLGLGKASALNRDRYRKAFGTLFKKIQQDKISEVSILLDSVSHPSLREEECASLIAETMGMATYQLSHFKTTQQKELPFLSRLSLITDTSSNSLLYSLATGYALSKGVNTARHLIHSPANLLTSTAMAEFARELALMHDFSVDILEKEDIERLGMGALLAVNQGSSEPPALIVIKYQGLEEWKNVTAFIGKGITYDTGGYSIKSKTGMPGMKGDMGGAAAVLGAMETIGRIKPKCNILAVIPSTDNMISGEAFKPDDVITSMSGRTIEVLNTDAEGRLALADGITYAKQQKVDRIIDVATLTGGVVTALGSWMTGAMTNDQMLYEKVRKMAELMGEPVWQLPYNEDYRTQVKKSDVADLNNSPTRKAHPIMAGAFIGEFAEDTPWVHLDIAGTSIAESAYELGPKGPTGVMVRTLAGFAMES
ncbi:putative cytosol aminopeptidase [Halobacillus andaensis]|uniref:Probable cytosol aminopeptidase n=1 Tax=Halobacillus andaensis TaxID=1176239 RepID=A0A917EY09_HALAA|nr:leucyl aminopeptidase [Halobacillus andaensis]MBP2005595.1 leucyl aminopeptidase [Halobacillus andaensis]GGF32738.1 putative cytosol aminopeptidase [Halobacillus andaensis]